MPERRNVLAVQQRQNRSERVFGEELLTPEHHQDKPDAIAELHDEGTPWSVREAVADQPFRDERESHREAGRQAGPRQRLRRAGELLLAFPPDRLVHDFHVDGASLLGFVALPLGEIEVVFYFVFHVSSMAPEFAGTVCARLLRRPAE